MEEAQCYNCGFYSPEECMVEGDDGHYCSYECRAEHEEFLREEELAADNKYDSQDYGD